MSQALYRTFKSNYVPYFPDGNGRDRYIAYDNAGFYKNVIGTPKSLIGYKTNTFLSTKIPFHMKTKSIKTPNFHYHADGTGRDKYIIVNGGGLFTDMKPLISYKLTDFLRNNEDNISPTKKTRTYLSRDELKYNKLLKNIEKNLIKRLYTNDKKKFIRRPMMNMKTVSSFDEANKANTNFSKNITKYKIIDRYNTEKNSLQDLDMTNKETFPRLNKIKKIRPKIIIDSISNNNRTEINPYDNKVITDYENLRKYQFKSKSIQNRRKPYYYISNTLSN
jgi:hypothetical protein